MSTIITLLTATTQRSRHLLLLALIGLVISVTGVQSSPAAAQSCGGPIRIGQAVIGQIARAGVSCGYTLTGKRGDIVALRMSAVTSTLDPFLEITPPRGTATRDNDGGGNRNAAIVGYELDNGTYSIRAGSNNGRTSGAFQLALASCGALPGVGRSANDSLTSGQIACYQFTGQQGQTIEIRVEKGRADRSFEPALDLYTPTGSLITSARGAANARLSARLPNSGTYTVIARSSQDQGTGHFTIRRER